LQKRTQGTPALWGIDRHAPRATTVIYVKGALRLYEWKGCWGEKRFWRS